MTFKVLLYIIDLSFEVGITNCAPLKLLKANYKFLNYITKSLVMQKIYLESVQYNYLQLHIP